MIWKKIMMSLCLVLALGLFSACGKKDDRPEMNINIDEDGNRVQDGDIQYFYDVPQGKTASVHISVNVISGSLSIDIHEKNNHDKHQYRGTITESTEFDVEITEVNEYRIYVVADELHGDYSIDWKLD